MAFLTNMISNGSNLSPHHNGSAESMVKSLKASLNKIVKEKSLTEKEFHTIFVK